MKNIRFALIIWISPDKMPLSASCRLRKKILPGLKDYIRLGGLGKMQMCESYAIRLLKSSLI